MNLASPAPDLPPQHTLERWAYDYVTSTSLEHKLTPPVPPAELEANPVERLLGAPGRPSELRPTQARFKSPTPNALRDPHSRARLLHVFFHHELQAAELMCWAFLRFAGADRDFRKGLISIGLDEVRHMNLYRDQIERLGFSLGAFPVRDWFWERVPTCTSVPSFCALMGLGLEAANLEHSQRFAQWFRQAGDHDAARVQEQVGREEVAHVAFGRHWFEAYRGELCFDDWRAALPPPLSPLLLRGDPLNLAARRKARLPEEFLRRLASWQPECYHGSK